MTLCVLSILTRLDGNAIDADVLVTSQSRKHRGYKTQRVVADYLRQWWPYADSTGAGRTGSDIINVPFDVEVKARTGFQPKAALDQLKSREQGKIGFAVLRLNGQGENPKDYCALMRFEDLAALLVAAGYHKQQIQEPIRCDSCGSWKIDGQECKTCQLMNINATPVRPRTI
jgi:hypothetical protein